MNYMAVSQWIYAKFSSFMNHKICCYFFFFSLFFFIKIETNERAKRKRDWGREQQKIIIIKIEFIIRYRNSLVFFFNFSF